MPTGEKPTDHHISELLKNELQQILKAVDSLPKDKQTHLLQLLQNWKNPHRRTDKREDCSAMVDFTVDDKLFSGSVLDLSAGGACVSCDQTFRKGQTVVLTFQLPETEKPVKASGKIVWAKSDCFGVSFTSVSDALYEHFGNAIVDL